MPSAPVATLACGVIVREHPEVFFVRVRKTPAMAEHQDLSLDAMLDMLEHKYELVIRFGFGDDVHDTLIAAKSTYVRVQMGTEALDELPVVRESLGHLHKLHNALNALGFPPQKAKWFLSATLEHNWRD